MVCSEKKRFVFIVSIIFFVIIISFSLNIFAAEEVEITGNLLEGFNIQGTSQGVLVEGSSKLLYFSIEPGKTYKIIFDSDSSLGTNRFIFQSSEVPEIGVDYTLLANINSGTSYTFTAASDYVCIFSVSGNVNILNLIKVYEMPSGMSNSIDTLVDNVGVDSIWGIFEIAIDYIWVVVLVAFGIFIITRLIKKLSRGKEGM